MNIRFNYDLGWIKTYVICNIKDDMLPYEIRELWEEIYDRLKNVDYTKLNDLNDLKKTFFEKLNDKNVIEIGFIFDVDIRGGIELCHKNL